MHMLNTYAQRPPCHHAGDHQVNDLHSCAAEDDVEMSAVPLQEDYGPLVFNI